MASRAVQSLLASRHERSRPHQIVVRVGAAASWFAAVIYLISGAVSGDESLLALAVGPVLAATFMTIQIVAEREDGGVALFGSGLIVAIWSSAFGNEGTILPAAVSLVLIGALGMLFVVRFRTVVSATLGLALFTVPLLWQIPTDQKIMLGAVMGLTFMVTHFILSSIQTASAALNDRYQLLFEESPSAVLEEDWSEALAYVRSEYAGKPSRIRQFLLAYPTVVRRAVGKAKIVRANEAALKLLDVSNPARFLGYRNPDAINEENMESWVSALVRLFEGGRTWEHEVPFRTQSGELRWLLNRSVDTSASTPGSSIVVGLADITHIKSRNEAMAQVVKAKDEFVANVSHELRTPLTAVIGLTSELAGAEGLSDEMRNEMLQLVAGQAAEMANIVDDLLVAARAEVGTVSIDSQPVDLTEELQGTLEGLGMSIEMPLETTPAVFADPRRVRQILRNLLTNARRYGGPHRRVILGTIRGSAWLEVRDDGDGIPEQDVDRIFEPYVTSGGSGTVGLGLAVARQLAELMGGTLQYEHSAGESVFRLQLPLASSTQPVLVSQSDSA